MLIFAFLFFLEGTACVFYGYAVGVPRIFPLGYLTIQIISHHQRSLGASHIYAKSLIYQTHASVLVQTRVYAGSVSHLATHSKIVAHLQFISVSFRYGAGVDRRGAVAVSTCSPVIFLQMDAISHENVLLGNQ